MTLKRRNFLYMLTASVGAITAGACQASGNNVPQATAVAESPKIAQTPGLLHCRLCLTNTML